MNFIEDTSLTGIRQTSDGYLVGEVDCARTGIQLYTGDEVGRPDMDVVAVYRSEDEVFSRKSLQTYAGKPTTNDHPPVPVDASNWKEYAVGDIGEEVIRNGDRVRVPIKLMDSKVIDQVLNGKREISMGYTTELVFEDGVTKDGQPYQAKQTNLNMNHLAIVQRGRAGHECRVGDSADKWGASPLTIDKEETKVTDTLRNVIVDGLSVKTTDEGAQAIDKLTKELTKANDALEVAGKASTETIIAKDAELAKKDAEIDLLKEKQLSDADIDALVAKRSKLISDAKTLSKDTDFDGLSELEIMLAAVTAVRGEDVVKDKEPAYIKAAFDLALEGGVTTDKFQKGMQGRKAPVQTGDNGYQAYKDRLENAHKEAK